MRGLLLAVLTLTCTSCAAEPDRWTEPWTGMELALLEAGRFEMGSPMGELGRERREMRHTIRLTRPFYIGTTEVTQAQWRKVMGSNPSHFQPPAFATCPDCPVEQVNYWHVQEFLSRLSARAGFRFRLPTEAEWEFACRAGANTAYAFGDELSLQDANFDGNGFGGNDFDDGARGRELGRTSPVASYRPNRWGLFDFHGNVWEWTSDPLCAYLEEGAEHAERADPRPGCASPWKVIRGGNYLFGADSARCALRYTHRPRDLGPGLGFRVVREVSSVEAL